MTEFLLAVAAAAGIPSAIVGLLMWMLQRKIIKREERREAEQAEKERDREQFEINLLESVNATMALSEATARAVQRIPDAHCNGDMHKALAYEEDIKQKQRDFLMKKGVHSIV